MLSELWIKVYVVVVVGYFWMSNDYIAVATDSHFDPVFKACEEATVKTIDRSTFWTTAPSRAFCQKCKQCRLKAIDEYSAWVIFLILDTVNQ